MAAAKRKTKIRQGLLRVAKAGGDPDARLNANQRRFLKAAREIITGPAHSSDRINLIMACAGHIARKQSNPNPTRFVGKTLNRFMHGFKTK